MSLLTIWKPAPSATHPSPALASLLCFKSAFFNGSLSHLPTAIPAAFSSVSNTARAVQKAPNRMSAFPRMDMIHAFRLFHPW
jgi:hypothetical protein